MAAASEHCLTAHARAAADGFNACEHVRAGTHGWGKAPGGGGGGVAKALEGFAAGLRLLWPQRQGLGHGFNHSLTARVDGKVLDGSAKVWRILTHLGLEHLQASAAAVHSGKADGKCTRRRRHMQRSAMLAAAA